MWSSFCPSVQSNACLSSFSLCKRGCFFARGLISLSPLLFHICSSPFLLFPFQTFSIHFIYFPSFSSYISFVFRLFFLSLRPRFSHLIFHLSFLLFASQNFSHLCLVFHLLQAYFRILPRPLFKSNFFNSFLVIYMKPILSFALHSLVLSFYEPR